VVPVPQIGRPKIFRPSRIFSLELTIESGWPRAQVVIRDDYRYVVGTPSGKGQVDQFLALLAWVASRGQGFGNLTLADDVGEPVGAH